MWLSLRMQVLVNGWLNVVFAMILLINTLVNPSFRANFYFTQFFPEAVPVLLLIAGIWIACSVLLLGGTYKRNHILFLPWLIFIVLLFPIKVTEIVLHASSYYTNVKLMILVCCFLTIAIGLFIFKYIKVLSYYRSLRRLALTGEDKDSIDIA